MARMKQSVGGRALADMASESATIATEVTTVAEEAAEKAKAVTATSFEQTVAAMKDGVTKATSAAETSQFQFKEGFTKTMKTAEEVVAFGQGNVEALIKSGQIWSTGLQDISKQMASSLQASYEETMSAFKALTSVKSLKEAVDLQVGLARSYVEKGVAESSKYTDASLKLAEQAMAPISSRMTLAVEKFSKPV